MITDLEKKKIQETFDNYALSFGKNDPRVKLKVDHTHRVADISYKIAKSLTELGQITSNEADVAWMAGMLHDIGRFEQLKRYGTFVDNMSIDHAELGADILFQDGLISLFIDDRLSFYDEFLDIIEVAIRQHNKYKVVEDIPLIYKKICDIIRDADKIDIFKVVCETPYDVRMTMSERNVDSPARDEIMYYVRNHSSVKKLENMTGFESRVACCAMAFDIVYKISWQIIDAQKYLLQMISYNPTDEIQKKQMEELRREIEIMKEKSL